MPTVSTDYVVIRPGPGLPEGFLPEHWNGRWIDLAQIPVSRGVSGNAVAVPTGRFEARDDGAIAEIYEVRP